MVIPKDSKLEKTLNTLYKPDDLLETTAITYQMSTVTFDTINPFYMQVDIVLLQPHTSYQVELLYYKVHYFRFPIKHNPCARTLEIPQSMAETFTTLIWMITHYIDSLVNQNNHHNTSRIINPYWQKYHKGT